ncbi:helix-turn-helix domain-containing protein [Sporolactobacillus pectinivorans]|uniref:helix-turn-helix domain-containing protein n=1 Tax=Sporolactobacillus pectinivorans TaxID=1591408 RepID=UPI0012FD6352|nr:helix-turn-helix transcriptional regulator [Sporolactobacillus pectinivorans]
MEYIQNIKRIRRGLGLTQQELAGPGLSRSMISLIESGRSVPSLKTLQIIADKLGVPVQNLMEDEPHNQHEIKLTVSDEIIQKRISVCKALLKAKKLNEAEKLLSETAQLTKNNVFARGLLLKEKGMIAFERKDFTQAINAFEEALLYITPDHVEELMEIYCQLAETYRNNGNYVLAIENALYGNIITKTKQIQTDPLIQLKLYYNLANCYCRQKEFHRGLEVINQALKVMKETKMTYLEGNFYILKGSSESYFGDHNAALKSDQTALSLFQVEEDEKNRQRIMGCLVNLGIDYRFLKKFNQSYAMLLRSYKMMEEGWPEVSLKNVIYELSLTLVYLDKYDEAQNWIAKGLDIQTDENSMNGKLTYIAALICFHQNELQAAKRSADRAQTLLGGNAYWEGKCLKLKGEILFKEGQNAEAYRIADEALDAQLKERDKIYFEE